MVFLCYNYFDKTVEGTMALTNFSNGLRLNVLEMPELNTATICVNIVGGFQGETQLLNGTCEMISRLLLCGTTSYPTPSLLNNYAKSQGLVANCIAHKEYLEISVNCLKNKINVAIDFVYDILFNSVFDNTYIEIARKQISDEIEFAKLNPSETLTSLTNQALFARTGLTNSRLGNARSITRIKREDVLAMVEKYRTPKNIVVSIGGAVEEEAIEQKIRETFYIKLADTEFKQIKYVSHIDNFEGYINIKKRSFNQSRIEISFPSLSFKDDDKYALEFITRALETELKDRLKNEPYFKSLKIVNRHYANNGKLVFVLIVDSQDAETFIEKMLINVKDIITTLNLSRDEFNAEKNSYITNFVLEAEKSDTLTKLCAKELVIAKKEFVLNDKFNALASANFENALKILKKVIRFDKINIVYLGEPIQLEFLKDIIVV